jgi:hypothetical protein
MIKVNLTSQCSHLEVLLLSKVWSERGGFQLTKFSLLFRLALAILLPYDISYKDLWRFRDPWIGWDSSWHQFTKFLWRSTPEGLVENKSLITKSTRHQFNLFCFIRFKISFTFLKFSFFEKVTKIAPNFCDLLRKAELYLMSAEVSLKISWNSTKNMQNTVLIMKGL